MSVSTNAQICFGCLLEDEVELPWDADEFEGDIEHWWRKINGYEPPFEAFTPDGMYAPGFSTGDPRVGEYFDHGHAWDKEHPLPVEFVNCCSADCPQWIVTCPGGVRTARRGDPTQFVPADLTIPADAQETIFGFLRTYGIEHDQEKIGWWLSSYWG